MKTEKEWEAEIEALMDKARKLIREATEIADATGLKVQLGLGGYLDGWYQPDPCQMTKAEALAEIESGEAMDDLERARCERAIREDLTEDDDEWHSSQTGWVNSSSFC